MPEKLEKSKERVRKYGEVYTPEWVVKMMCDNLPPEAWDADHTILEPTCGNGNFLVEITRRKMARCRNREEACKALNTVYGIDLLHDNVQESRDRMQAVVSEFFPGLDVSDILERRIIQGNTLEMLKRKEFEWPCP